MHSKFKGTYRPGASLYTVGLLALLIGGGVTYFFYREGHSYRTAMSISAAITLIVSGIFIISASARWFVNR